MGFNKIRHNEIKCKMSKLHKWLLCCKIIKRLKKGKWVILFVFNGVIYKENQGKFLISQGSLVSKESHMECL